MFVYVMKCANYYKIGYSKNPTTRRRTIQTHNPFKVELCAILKTQNYAQLEKRLHKDYYLKKTSGEWFELKYSDLEDLSLSHGFDFKIPLSKLYNDVDFDNSKDNQITKTYRVSNRNRIMLIAKFEHLFSCEIKDLSNIKFCFTKYDHDVIDETIVSLYNRDMRSIEAYSMLKKTCKYNQLKKDDPLAYMEMVICSIYRGYYNHELPEDDVIWVKSLVKRIDDVDDFLKHLNKNKYYCDSEELFNVMLKYTTK